MTYKKLKLPFPKEHPIHGNAHFVIGWQKSGHELNFLCQLSEEDANTLLQMAIKMSRTVPTGNLNAEPEVIQPRMDADVARRVMCIIKEQLGLPKGDGIDIEAHLFDVLGADDLDYTELIMALEDEFVIDQLGTQHAYTTPPEFTTPKQLIEAVLRKPYT